MLKSLTFLIIYILFSNLYLIVNSKDFVDCGSNTSCGLKFLPIDRNAAQIVSSDEIDLNTNTAECADLEDMENLTQTDFINRLTATCRYDRLERPKVLLENGSLSRLEVSARTFIYAMQSTDTTTLWLTLHGLVQLRYADPRLAFGKYAPTRQESILGEGQLNDQIWVPHIILTSVQDTKVLGTNEKDILTSISADGTVIISARIEAKLNCWVNIWKFPFDEKFCTMRLNNWMYDSSELLLKWEQELPTVLNSNINFIEYYLISAWCDESVGSILSKNYSSLSLTVHLMRKSERYILSYFLPSIIIVAITWVSFWLAVDTSPAPRTTICSSTLLSLITLSLAQGANVPKVDHVIISDIWFLGCNLFVFGSLIEFTFVHTISNRKRNVELKKVNSKHVLKNTVIPRNKFQRYNSKGGGENCDSLEMNNENSIDIELNKTVTSMKPNEIALWIDRKARFLFPICFLIFNVIFWTLAYYL